MRLVTLAVPAAFLLTALAGTPGGASAQDHPSREDRQLGGHSYIPSGRLPDPFVTTHARFRTAGGLATGYEAEFVVPVVDTVRITKGDIGFFGLDFEYQQNLWNRWAFRASFEGNARTGTDLSSLLASGLSSVYGAELEGKFRLLRKERMQVTLHALLTRKNLFGLSLLQFAEDVIEDSTVNENATLVVEGRIRRTVFGPSVAYTFKPWLGATGFAFVGPADPFDDAAKDQTAFRGGVTGSVDFGKLGWAPIGILAGYDYDSFPEGANDIIEGVYAITFAGAFTGREDYSIGFEITSSRIRQKDLPDEFGAITFSINSRYYF
ncbi:MAG: hypothetical protein ACREOU_05280 [Candidatus Eiseniibacteriota bacterium]